MGKKMKRKPERIFEDIKTIRKGLDKLTLPTLAQLSRIDRYEADDVGGSSGPKPKNQVSDPTGNRVAAKRTVDPVGDAVKAIDSRLFNMAREMQTLLQQLDYALNPRDRHRQSAVIHCGACEREVAGTNSDRLRSGYCFSCYRKWIAQERPNRGAFEAEQKRLDAEA
jgi:hypothetical protein